MPIETSSSWIAVPIEIAFIDLLLGGDNAVIIALACRGLPAAYLRPAMLYGTVAAILFRLVLAAAAGALIALPYLKLASAGLLVIIAVNLMIPGDVAAGDEPAGAAWDPDLPRQLARGLWFAVGTIILADAIMSLDNIVALAAIAQGNVLYLAAGLALSIPMLVFGGMLLNKLLNTYPILVTAGGAILGWVAGELAIGDAAVAQWVAYQAPALSIVAPLLGAIFVVAEGAILASAPTIAQRRGSAALGLAAKLRTTLPNPEPAPIGVAPLRLLPPETAWARPSPRLDPAPVPDGLPAHADPQPQASEGSASQTDVGTSEDRLVMIGLFAMFAFFALFIGLSVMIGGGLLD